MNNATGYTVGQKIVHWLMAMFLLIDLTVAQQFGSQLALADRLQNREGHAAVGTIILVLFLIRIYLRRKHGAPALPATTPSWQSTAANLTHKGFYLLLTIVIATGIYAGMNVTSPLNWFGAVDIAVAGNLSEEHFQSVRVFHEWATKALIALILLHVLAAILHLIQRDGRTTAMLAFWKRS